jgi:hypothetical protein
MEFSAKARLPLLLCRYYLPFALLLYFHSYSMGKLKGLSSFFIFGD